MGSRAAGPVLYSLGMSNYLALYRKWRPRNFAELVGQEHVARTLSNAITSNQLAHAYLFTGPRGTGKTSSARIFAKSLNCEAGPTVSPCDACAACLAITQGCFADVIEIDAASNRGVDDARDLRDRVRFAPTHGRFKVFIIDEVHMLTNEAFNALLKTIEEPPPKLVFILATTDVHKVLPTIISRTQRFDFQRIPFKLLVGHLRHVAQQERMEIAEAGIEAIAKRADGGLRDALSLLDQVRSCAAAETITLEDVFAALGLVSHEAVASIVRAIADAEVTSALEGVNGLLGSGFDHHAVVRELLECFRNLMLVGVAGDRVSALQLPELQLETLKALAVRFTGPEILYALEVLRETETMLKGSNQMTIWLEMAAIRLCQRQEIPSISALARRVSALEERLAQGSLGPPARAAARPVPAKGPVSQPIAQTRPPASNAPVANPPVIPVPRTPSGRDPEAPAPRLFPHADETEALATLLPALARIHRSTHSLLEQHALYARLEGDTLVLGIKATMRSFFEKADRKTFLDKAVAQVFPTGVRVSLSFEQGDSARTKSATIEEAHASSPRVREAVSVPVRPEVDEGESPEDPTSLAGTERPAPVVDAGPLPEPHVPPAALPGDELVSRAADIFNGRIIEPTR